MRKVIGYNFKFGAKRIQPNLEEKHCLRKLVKIRQKRK